jgi:hypothetical protein
MGFWLNYARKSKMSSDTRALSSIIARDFELDPGISEEGLRLKMVHAFSYLLDHDISRMMNILYRADVDEDKLKKLLINSSQLPSAEIIADAYIERQKQKVETWKKYS